jgi:flagellar protein FliS
MMQACGVYRNTQVRTARPETLVTLLYSACIRVMRTGREALEQGRREEAGCMLIRAQDIVVELRASLNAEAGEIAGNLSSLYEYVQDRLMTANIKKDAGPVDDALRVMEGIYEAWIEALRVAPR